MSWDIYFHLNFQIILYFSWNVFFCFQATGYLKRADTDQLRAIFDKYASAKIDGETYMTEEDFLVGYLKFFPEKDYNKESAKVLCGILDQRKDG